MEDWICIKIKVKSHLHEEKQSRAVLRLLKCLHRMFFYDWQFNIESCGSGQTDEMGAIIRFLPKRLKWRPPNVRTCIIIMTDASAAIIVNIDQELYQKVRMFCHWWAVLSFISTAGSKSRLEASVQKTNEWIPPRPLYTCFSIEKLSYGSQRGWGLLITAFMYVNTASPSL